MLHLFDEAVNAFLTSLTVLFVPLILALTTRRLPNPTLWIGVLLAVASALTALTLIKSAPRT